MPDLGDSFTVGGADDFLAQLSAEQGGIPFTDPRTGETVESGTTEPVVPAVAGVAPVVTPGSPTPESGAAPESVSKEEHDNLLALMGRMSTELGELRKAVTPQPEPEPTYDFTPMPVTDEVEAQLIDAISKSGGQAVAIWAAGNRPDLYEAVLDLWSDPDISGDRGGARKAAAFDMRFQQNLQQAGETQQEQERQRFITEIAPVLDQQVTAIGPEYGLAVGTPEVDELLAATLEGARPALKNLVISRDAEEREAGLRAILAEAAFKSKVGTVTDPEAAAALEKARADALAATKGAASLGTGGLQLGTEVADLTPEAALAQRIEQLNSSPKPTSVASGLSGGGFGSKPAA